MMPSENICLFNPVRSSDLICRDFVSEHSDCAREPHTAACFVLHLVSAGTGTWVCEGQERRLMPGTVFLVCPNETYSIRSDGALQYFYITFYGRRAVEVAGRMTAAKAGHAVDGFADLVPFWQDCLTKANADNVDLLSEAVLLYTLARLAPRKRAVHGAVEAALEVTDEYFTDPDLTLGAVAAKLGYDPKYLSFAFRREQGMTYSQYLRDLRVRRAAFLMEQGVVGMKNVARLSGFRDPLYFSKVFAKVNGVSPRAYLAALTQKERQT